MTRAWGQYSIARDQEAVNPADNIASMRSADDQPVRDQDLVSITRAHNMIATVVSLISVPRFLRLVPSCLLCSAANLTS